MINPDTASGQLAAGTGRRKPLIDIVDDLEALELLVDVDYPGPLRFAGVWRERPSLRQIRSRAQFHTAELGRLLDQVREGRTPASDEVRAGARGLAMLINCANIATVLVAHRTPADYRALAGFRRAMWSQARKSRDSTIRDRVSRICGGKFVAMSEQYMRPARLPRAAPLGPDAEPGKAAAYSIELMSSLALWVDTGTDPAGLLDGARELFRQIDIWRRVQAKLTEPALLDEPIRGAELLAYARLARLSLWPARDADEAKFKRDAIGMVGPRSWDADHMRATIEWAVDLERSLAA